MEERQALPSSPTFNATTVSVTISNANISFMNNSSVEYQTVHSEISRLVLGVSMVLLVLSALGLFGNLVALWVWQASTSFNATTFLLKCLSMWDSTYLASVILFFTFVSLLSFSELLIFVSTFCLGFSQSMSMHTTLLVAVSRWVAVRHPLKARRLLTRRHVWLSCLLIFLWAALSEITYSTLSLTGFMSELTTNVAYKTTTLGLPLIILLCFNISLLITVHRRSQMDKVRGATHHSSEEQMATFTLPDTSLPTGNVGSKDATDQLETQTLAESPETRVLTESPETLRAPDTAASTVTRQHVKLHLRPRSVFLSEARTRRRVTATVLCVSLTSFITYPVCLTCLFLAVLKFVENMRIFFVLMHVTFLCQIINSSINVVFYTVLSSNFRELVRLRAFSCGRVCSKR